MSAFAESFLLGLVQSLHCASMCGPLAACAQGLGATTWHVGRGLGYAVAGAGLGAVGTGLGSRELASPGAIAALVLALGLVATTLFGERILQLRAVSSLARPLISRALRLPPLARGMALGSVTVLLPCGLLWLAFAAAAVAGSALQGMLAMLGFVLGSLPLLVGAQLGLAAVPAIWRRWLPLAAAGLLLWRAWAGLGGQSCCG